MWALALAIASAQPADDVQATNDLLAPLRFLVGKCWRGTFGEGPAYDVMCAEEMPGGFIRTRHAVRGVEADYRGETIYHHDGAFDAIGFTYFASSGGVTQGVTEHMADGSLRFLDSRYQYPDGSYHWVRGRIAENENGTFATHSAILRADGWEEQPLLVMHQVACADWAAVEAGCD